MTIIKQEKNRLIELLMSIYRKYEGRLTNEEMELQLKQSRRFWRDK